MGRQHAPRRWVADVGARPGEALALEWRHVDLDNAVVELLGVKTDIAWRTVHMTDRGVSALAGLPRDGRPVTWPYFCREVWHPALALAGLAKRPPYSMRHSYALNSLQAGGPIATLARQMGHANVSRTFTVYGGWVREIGAEAAAMREAWINGTNRAPDTAESDF
jgi:integrase